MGNDFENAIAFGNLLSTNSKAAEIYDSYTDAQRTAVLLELRKLKKEHVKNFVEHLPSSPH